jgi:chromosome segregation ATPase
MERYKAKRNDIQTLQSNLTALERTLTAVSTDEASRLQSINMIEAKLSSISREIKEQEAKRERAFKSVQKGIKDVKSMGTSETDELDLKIRECKDLGNLIQSEISRIMENYPEITMKVIQLYTEVR